MTIEPGRQLLHYRVLEKIGEGGMGEVWKALDTDLDREVALKVLPAALADDTERLARLEREARLLASLTHAGIAAVYGLHAADGVRFIALELVRGEDLAQRLARGPLAVDEALTIADRVAEAVAAAHDSGVIHRDLKPANVKITPEGDVKVLDFGLAKALDDEVGKAAPVASHSPTLTSQGTVAGVILGTAAYMSPEQTKGLAVDRRADTWAFGCLLFELLTGRPAFDAPTVSETLADILRGEPDWALLPAGLPAGVTAVLRRCLTKDPRRRLRDVGDARLLLEEARAAAGEGRGADAAAAAGTARGRWRERSAWLALVVVLAVVGAYLVWSGRSATGPADAVTRFSVELTGGRKLTFIDRAILTLSPDGRTLAFLALDPESGNTMVHLRPLGQNAVWPVPGTEHASAPFFSPDGREIGFFAEGQLKKVSVGGGSPTTLAEAPNTRGAVWLADGRIVYSPRYTGGLWQVPGNGGTAEPLWEPEPGGEERTYRWVDAMPGGDVLIYTVGDQRSPNNYDGARVAVFDPERKKSHVLIERTNTARFLGRDRLVFMRQGQLLMVGFDPERLEVVGDAVPVLEDVGGDPSSGVGYFALSWGGTLAYVPGAVSNAEAALTVVGTDGSSAMLPLDPGRYHHPRFSPDGGRIAFSEGRGEFGSSGDVWIYSSEDGALDRFTFDQRSIFPAWEPGGERLTFSRYGEGSGIYSRSTDGSGGEETVLATDLVSIPGSWSPDGRTLAYTVIDRTTDVYLVEHGGKPRLFESDASSPEFSPDGRYLAYSSPSSGNTVVFVRRVEGEGKWQVSRGLGGYPHWTADGKRLFYIDISSLERPLMVCDVDTGATFRAGPPRPVLDSTGEDFTTATSPMVNWDAAPDGERFVFVSLRREAGAAERVELVLHWGAELGKVAAP